MRKLLISLIAILLALIPTVINAQQIYPRTCPTLPQVETETNSGTWLHITYGWLHLSLDHPVVSPTKKGTFLVEVIDSDLLLIPPGKTVTADRLLLLCVWPDRPEPLWTPPRGGL